MLKAIEEEIDNGRGVQREQLADNQSADDGDSQRTAQFGARAGSKRQRQRAQQRRHGRHQNRAGSAAGSLENGSSRVLALVALGRDGEVDHHDGVLLHNADQQNDSDDAR